MAGSPPLRETREGWCTVTVVDTESPKVASRPDAQLGARFTLLFAILCLLGFALLAFSLGARGVSSRSLGSGGREVSDSAELIGAADSLGARGVVVLAATGTLGYTPVDVDAPSEALAWPVERVDLPEHYRSEVGRASWAWVLAKTGTARRIDYLMPTVEYRLRVAEGREQGFPGISADGSSITANDEGYLRHISDQILRKGDPLLLIVDASYFENGTEDELFARLEALTVPPASVIVNDAIDDPEVSPGAREALANARPRILALVGTR